MKIFSELNKKIIKFSVYCTAFIATLIYLIPWIISNNVLHFPFNIIALMVTLCIWLIILINAGKNFYFNHKKFIDSLFD